MLNKLYLIILIFLLSCSSPKDNKYTYPISNPYPKLFETIQSSSGELLLTRVSSKSAIIDCRKRTDGQPYYWCSLEADLLNPQKNLPKKLFLLFHVQLPPSAVKNVKKLLKRIKMKGKNISVISHRNPDISERNMITSQMFAFYNKKDCVAFLNMEDELCPKNTHHINIYRK